MRGRVWRLIFDGWLSPVWLVTIVLLIALVLFVLVLAGLVPGPVQKLLQRGYCQDCYCPTGGAPTHKYPGQVGPGPEGCPPRAFEIQEVEDACWISVYPLEPGATRCADPYLTHHGQCISPLFPYALDQDRDGKQRPNSGAIKARLMMFKH